jgi:hypothetical protein
VAIRIEAATRERVTGQRPLGIARVTTATRRADAAVASVTVGVRWPVTNARVAVFGLSLLLAACGRTDQRAGGANSPGVTSAASVASPDAERASARPADSVAIAPANSSHSAQDSAAAFDTLAAIIARAHLTSLRRECYVFEDQPGTAPYAFTVREKHGGRCGGDPNVAPRLFDITWDPATGIVTTDARRVDGEFDTLRLAPRKTENVPTRPPSSRR